MLEKRHRDFGFECEALAFSALSGRVSNLDRLGLMARVLRDFADQADACAAALSFCDTSVLDSQAAGRDLRRLPFFPPVFI